MNTHDIELPPLPTPDSYLFQHEETGLTECVDGQQVEWGFEKNNPRHQRIGGMFTESQMQAYARSAIEADRQRRGEPVKYPTKSEIIKAAFGDKLKDAVQTLEDTPAASAKQVDKGPWRAGVNKGDHSHFVESDDFEHDVRLYIEGDFGGENEKQAYAEGIAKQLNTAPVATQAQPEGVTLDGCLETLFRLGEYLGVDYAAARKALGPPSEVYIKAIEAKIAATQQPVSGADGLTEAEMCQRCQGNGEIVTDWDRYKHPAPGDVGDEAVAECPDCDGTGNIESAAQPQPSGNAGELLTRDRIEEIAREVYKTERFTKDDEVWHNLYWLTSFAKAVEKEVQARAALAAQASGQAQQDTNLTGDELQAFINTCDQFSDCGETDTNDTTLMRWAALGLLECTRFEVTPRGDDLIDAARAAAKGEV